MMGIKEEITSNHDMEYYDISYLAIKYNEVKKSGHKYALVHMNVKNFRYYNTKYGCDMADQLLRLFFCKMKDDLNNGEYAAHIYADNFAMLVRYEDIETLMRERIISLIDKLYRIHDDRIYRNGFFSFGIYEIENDDVKFLDALNYANLCRKESRTIANRSSCIESYDEIFYKKYMDRIELEVKTANAYIDYEFITYFQPKVDLKTEKIIGAEVLLRWFDKEGNSIPLYQFLPILNQNGYIIVVDLDIFEQTCRYLEERLAKHKKVVPISFNVSKSEFYRPEILNDYTDIFEKFNIPKNLIEFELMESISLNDTERIKKVIGGFKDYGFQCALDDFGNGYSSFGVLLNAQLDIIKMDRQFFLNNVKGNDKLVIETVVNLIHSLNMKVVAEGVELQEHIDCLKKCGCDYVQGYYYYKPMPIEEFEKLLDSQGICEEMKEDTH